MIKQIAVDFGGARRDPYNIRLAVRSLLEELGDLTDLTDGERRLARELGPASE